MWDREDGAKDEAACEPTASPYTTIKDFDNNGFYGMTGDYFFIDTGTSANSRTLFIYNTDSGYEIAKVDYDGSPSLVGGKVLMYDEPSEMKGRMAGCKDAAKWKRQGGSVGWVQSKRLDLKAEKTTTVGGLRCIYVE